MSLNDDPDDGRLVFVDVREGVRVGWVVEQRAMLAGLVGLLVTVLGVVAVGALTVLLFEAHDVASTGLVLLAGWVASLVHTGHFAHAPYQMVEVDGRGVTLSILTLRGLYNPNEMPVEALQDPEGHRYRFGESRMKRVAFVDLAAVGFTEGGVWFEDERGVRTELSMAARHPEEVERLFLMIEPAWKRARAAVDDDLETSRRAATKLRELVPRQSKSKPRQRPI